MNVYRANIQSFSPSGDGTVQADCFVEVRSGVSPDFIWTLSSNGHFTIVLTADEVLAITGGAGTNAQKRQSINDLIKARALARGVDKSDEAYSNLANLYPTFPFQVVIR